jgi:hypothetical protein
VCVYVCFFCVQSLTFGKGANDKRIRVRIGGSLSFPFLTSVLVTLIQSSIFFSGMTRGGSLPWISFFSSGMTCPLYGYGVVRAPQPKTLRGHKLKPTN